MPTSSALLSGLTILTGRPSPGRRSVREYLDTLDEAAWGAASETVPKFISRSDPAAQWTDAHKMHASFAYADNYLIDLRAAIIVDIRGDVRYPADRGECGTHND